MASLLSRFPLAACKSIPTGSGAGYISRTSLLRAFQALPKPQQLNLARAVLTNHNFIDNAGRGFATHAATTPTTPARTTTTTTRRTRTATAAKPGRPKKTTATKKKAAPKRKAKKAVKKPKKKKKVVAKKKVPTTPQEKLAAKVRELRKHLIKPPKALPQTAWQVFVKQEAKTVPMDKGVPAKFKSLSPREREHLNEEAIRNKHANEKAYADWLGSQAPEKVWQSNKAGNALRSLKRRSAIKTRVPQTIKDARQVKRPMGPYAHFFQERMSSGAMHGLSIGDIGKLMSQEWKETSPLEKQKYKDLAAADSLKYKENAQRVYGHVPSMRN